MLSHTHTTGKSLFQGGIKKKIYPRRLFLNFLILLVFTLTSCQKDSVPTYPSSPTDRDDVNVWKSVKIGQDSYGLIIAALHPDSIPRLYAGRYEYNYRNDSWSRTWMDSSDFEYMYQTAGRCRSDGILRMYGASPTGIYEFDYNGNRWVKQIPAIYSGSLLVQPGLQIGDPRNDGFESLYVIDFDVNGLLEIRYQDGAWENMVVHANTVDIYCMSIGDGRGEGKDGIYLMDRSTNVSELRYENASWTSSKLGQLVPLAPGSSTAESALAVTNTHNGHPNVIASDGDLTEFYLDSDHWTKVKIGSEPGINRITDGAGRNDGVDRLYCAVNFNIMAEYTLAGGSWMKTSQRKTGDAAALEDVVVGQAQGDGVNRIYVGTFINGLYEFTYNQ